MSTVAVRPSDLRSRRVAAVVGGICLVGCLISSVILWDAIQFVQSSQETVGSVAQVVATERPPYIVVEYSVQQPNCHAQAVQHTWRVRKFPYGADQRKKAAGMGFLVHDRMPLRFRTDNPSVIRFGTTPQILAIPATLTTVLLLIGVAALAMFRNPGWLEKPAASDQTPWQSAGLLAMPLGLIVASVALVAFVNDESRLLSGLLFFSGWTMLACGVAMILVPRRNQLRRRRMMQTGLAVAARVTELQQDRRIHLHGISPWRIVAVELQSAEPRTFVSHWLWIDPADSYPPGTRLLVYCDVEHPTSYTFRLDRLDRIQAWIERDHPEPRHTSDSDDMLAVAGPAGR